MHDFLQKLTSFDYTALMQWLFLLPAGVMLLAAMATVVLRNLIHCALSLTLSFIALGVLFLALGAEFIGFVQLLVYVGAVAILIIFAILLTRPEQISPENHPFGSVSAVVGGFIAWLVMAGLFTAIFFSSHTRAALPVAPDIAMADIGNKLLSNYVLPLQITGVLLTAALLGAALLAMEDKKS